MNKIFFSLIITILAISCRNNEKCIINSPIERIWIKSGIGNGNDTILKDTVDNLFTGIYKPDFAIDSNLFNILLKVDSLNKPVKYGNQYVLITAKSSFLYNKEPMLIFKIVICHNLDRPDLGKVLLLTEKGVIAQTILKERNIYFLHSAKNIKTNEIVFDNNYNYKLILSDTNFLP